MRSTRDIFMRMCVCVGILYDLSPKINPGLFVFFSRYSNNKKKRVDFERERETKLVKNYEKPVLSQQK